jgi:hypothetical protein
MTAFWIGVVLGAVAGGRLGMAWGSRRVLGYLSRADHRKRLDVIGRQGGKAR